MPKFLVTSGSYFDPFTYDELAKPITQTVEAHNATQDAYDTLSMETEALRQYLMQEPDDSYARQLYDDYTNKLSTLQNNLWNRGYNAGTRRDLAVAKAGYASNITRLQTGIKNRQERAAEYRKMKLDHPDMIMGVDPGLAPLDRYLENDRYGMDWFAYSGDQFEKEVGAEVEARAKEMLGDLTDPNNVVKNPRLEAILTRVINQGVTNAETLMAGSVVDEIHDMDKKARMAYYKENNTPDAVVILSEALINRYNATGIQNSDAPLSERQRLLERGKAGFAKGVKEPKINDVENPEFAYQMEIRKAQAKANIDYNNHIRKAQFDAALKAAQEGAALNSYDSYSTIVTGENAQKAMDATADYDITPGSVIVGKNGKEVRNKVDASELVWMDQDAIEAYDKLGFDYRLDPTPAWIDRFTPSSKYLHGEIEKDGKIYETRYAPYARVNGVKGQGFVQYREKGSDGKWTTSIEATNYYRQKRKEYEDNVKYYKENEKEIYKMATIDPEKRAKDYEAQGIDFRTPMSDFRSEVMHKPENATYKSHRIYFGREGTDKGKYLEMMTSYLTDKLELGSSLFDRGSFKKDKNRGNYTGNASYIHKLSDSNTLDNKAADPDDAFVVDKNGKITNVSGVEITPEGILEGLVSGTPYIVYNTTKGRFAVGIDMFQSDALTGIFNVAMYGSRDAYGNKRTPGVIDIINDDTLSEDDKEIMITQLTARVMTEMRKWLNDIDITQSKGGTSSKAEN